MMDAPAGCRLIAGHDGEYAIDEVGTVWSRKSGRWQRKRAWLNNGAPTVELWRYGIVTRRRVAVLLRETWGPRVEEELVSDRELRWYLREQYSLFEEDLEKVFA